VSDTDSIAPVEPAVCIDFKNPKAYLALAPTLALEQSIGVQFDWLPIAVAGLTRPPDARPDEDRGTRHRRLRAEYNDRDLRRYARVYGIELGELYRNPDVSLASMGLLWAKRGRHDAQRRYLQVVFERLFGGRLDVENSAAIASILAEVDVETVGWDAYVAGAGRRSFDATCAALRERGVFDVPAYLVAGDVFFGRQHLPMIRWLLDGKRGEPPL